MLITTNKENAIRRFKVSANTRLSDPFDFSTEPQPLSKGFNVGLKIFYTDKKGNITLLLGNSCV